MTLTPRHILIVALCAILTLGAAIVGAAYLHAMVSAGKQEQLKQDVQQQISTLQKDLASELAKIKQDQKITQPAQIVQRLPQYIELPKPIYIQPPVTVPSASAGGGLPDAPSSSLTASGALVVPAESVSAFWTHETQCKSDSLKLEACNKELPLMEKRAVAAERAMKGGGIVARVKSNAKWLALGGALGIVVGKVVIH